MGSKRSHEEAADDGVGRSSGADGAYLVETDAPSLAPPPHRGKRNEPAFVADTAARLAETLGLSAEELGERTTENFYRLFTKAERPG